MTSQKGELEAKDMVQASMRLGEMKEDLQGIAEEEVPWRIDEADIRKQVRSLVVK